MADAFITPAELELAKVLTAPLFGLLGGLVGVWLGARLTRVSQKEAAERDLAARREERVERVLLELLAESTQMRQLSEAAAEAIATAKRTKAPVDPSAPGPRSLLRHVDAIQSRASVIRDPEKRDWIVTWADIAWFSDVIAGELSTDWPSLVWAASDCIDKIAGSVIRQEPMTDELKDTRIRAVFEAARPKHAGALPKTGT